jgi:hypothetical protein
MGAYHFNELNPCEEAQGCDVQPKKLPSEEEYGDPEDDDQNLHMVTL